MNIFIELLSWYNNNENKYRQHTSLKIIVNDFLKQRIKNKVVFPCHNIKEVKENIVGILGLIGNPHLKTREDLIEIDNISMEIYEFLNK